MKESYEKAIVALIAIVFVGYHSWNWYTNKVDLSNYNLMVFIFLMFTLSRYKINKK